VEPSPPGNIQLTVQVAQRSTRSTGKDELLTLGTMLLLTMLVIGAALTPALVRHRPVPLVARTRDHRR
jgi:hypothetical protein